MKSSKTVPLNAARFTKKAEREYFAYLHEIIDNLYEQAADLDWSWLELSKRSKVSYGAILNLGHRRTRYPRLFTIYKLGKALGWEVNVQKIVSVKKKVV